MCKAGRLFQKKVMAGFMTAVAILFFFLASPLIARADGGLSLSTQFPGMTVKAGQTINYTLSLKNEQAAGADASLSVESMPDGWDGYFKGSGNQISRVYIGAGGEETGVSFALTIPSEAPEGIFHVILKADAGNGMASALNLELNVNELKAGQSAFTSEYARQQGATGTVFTYNATLVNNGADKESYALSANLPAGWQVAFKPSGAATQVASIDVESAGSQGLTITVTPPSSVKAGTYDIPCTAVSANGTLNLDLSVDITGTYGLSLSTPDGRLSVNASAGQEKAVTLSLTNTGTIDLKNINLTSSLPTDWNVRFDTASVDTLTAGSTQEITAYLTPGKDALTGDYVASLTARTDESSSQADFRVAVQTSTVWGIVAVLIIILLVCGLGMVFRRYGRR